MTQSGPHCDRQFACRNLGHVYDHLGPLPHPPEDQPQQAGEDAARIFGSGVANVEPVDDANFMGSETWTTRPHIGVMWVPGPSRAADRGRRPQMTRKRYDAAPIAPMRLGNMRSLGVRALSVTGLACNHQAVLPVDGYADETEVPAFGPRMAFTRCG